MKILNLLAQVIFVSSIIFFGCSEEETITPEVQITETFDSDYEEITKEDDYSIFIPPVLTFDTVFSSSPQGIFLRRATYIFSNLKSTNYVHYSGRLMDEANGIYNYDCSGFVGDFIIRRVLYNHYQDLSIFSHSFHNDDPRPRAWGFYDYFRDILGNDSNGESNLVGQNEYWKVFINADSIQQGDIIVVKYDERWRKKYAEHNGGKVGSTGHVMIAWSEAIIEGDSAKILILDSASSGHYNDTRDDTLYQTNGSGIGYGWMKYGLSQNGRNRPYKYRWKLLSGNWYKPYDPTTSYNSYHRLEGILIARPI